MCDNKTKIKDFDKNKNQKKCKLIENMKAKEEENEKKKIEKKKMKQKKLKNSLKHKLKF